MKEIERQAAAKKFIKEWSGKGYEKGECQKFWIDLLCNVFGIQDFASFILFEEQVKKYFVENETKQAKIVTNFIDAYIPSTHVIIEQKSSGKDLHELNKQSDGTFLTPFQQAKNNSANLPYTKRPRWIVTCNFDEFLIYDMERPDGEPQQIFLKDLQKEHYRLQFLVDTQNEHISREEEISLKAGKLVRKLYNALLKQYIDPDDRSLRSLNILCVRIVFCLYAEDAGQFATKTCFEDYIQSFKVENVREAIIRLFKGLDTKLENRDKYDTKLQAFPYVNGGLFAYEDIEIPNFNEEIVDILVNHCAPFDWSKINPTIFGAIFQSTLNPETRRTGGMEFTSLANIHKVIDPLFLNDLQAEYKSITSLPYSKIQKQKLLALQDKLASLKFLDPACGSGNFLTETFISLRRLENEILRFLSGDQVTLGEIKNPVKVSINQFYGIEINDFAVAVARTALWIAESQMIAETELIIPRSLEFLPLKNHATIVEGNALRMDWSKLSDEPQLDLFYTNKLKYYIVSDDFNKDSLHDVSIQYKAMDEMHVATKQVEQGILPQNKPKNIIYNYIIGNPPFIGARMMAQGSEQKKDIQNLFGDTKEVQDLDFVTGWYKKAAELIKGKQTQVAFVSTNSICQGSQVPILWKILFEKYGICINFAYQTFKWTNEGDDVAAVHCVIISFANFDKSNKTIYTANGETIQAKNICPYLFDGPATFVEAQKNPLCDIPKMNFGNQPRDGGNLIVSEEDYSEILKQESSIAKWLHPYIGAEEFINNKKRYCLWLKHAKPEDIKRSKILYGRVDAVRRFRLNSKAKTTNGYAKVPHLFAQITQPDELDYLLIPRVSSENRYYIPIGFMKSDTISSDAVQIIPHATLYHFGVLTSKLHMAWTRTVAGRLKSDYRYSKEIVYNNFPWSNPSDTQKAKIEATAQAILDVRAKHPNASLADLYDDLTMPADLRKAHAENDHAVMEAYGFNPKMTEDEIVAELFKMYRELTK